MPRVHPMDLLPHHIKDPPASFSLGILRSVTPAYVPNNTTAIRSKGEVCHARQSEQHNGT